MFGYRYTRGDGQQRILELENEVAGLRHDLAFVAQILEMAFANNDILQGQMNRETEVQLVKLTHSYANSKFSKGHPEPDVT